MFNAQHVDNSLQDESFLIWHKESSQSLYAVDLPRILKEVRYWISVTKWMICVNLAGREKCLIWVHSGFNLFTWHFILQKLLVCFLRMTTKITWKKMCWTYVDSTSNVAFSSQNWNYEACVKHFVQDLPKRLHVMIMSQFIEHTISMRHEITHLDSSDRLGKSHNAGPL